MNKSCLFVKGDRVKLSEEGVKKLKPKAIMPERLGTVIRIGNDGYPQVVWDGNRPTTVQFYHPDFLSIS